MIVRRPRAVIRVGPEVTIKSHVDAAAAAAEAGWYERVPWAAPRLLAVHGPDLHLQTLPVAAHLHTWRPVEQLRALLERLHGEGIHHRDVHVRNLVRGEGDEPLLIDWETAIHQPSPRSYDLHGPDASRVPVPHIHAGLTPQWWGSAQQSSIAKRWGA